MKIYRKLQPIPISKKLRKRQYKEFGSTKESAVLLN